MSRVLRFAAPLLLLIGAFWTATVAGAASKGRHAPAHHASPYVIVLDPGHGGVMHWGDESGAVSPDGTLLEKNLTLAVALQARTDLQRWGYTVYLTRTKDQHVNTPPRDWNGDGKINHVDELVARNVFANRHHADVFVSIHFDGADDSSMRGTHGYYCPARPFWHSSQRLADLLVSDVAAAVRHAGYADVNGGVETDVADVVGQEWPDYPWFLVLGPSRSKRVVGTNMPGALIESLFLSSPLDDAYLKHRGAVAALAQGYANGLRAYFHNRVDR